MRTASILSLTCWMRPCCEIFNDNRSITTGLLTLRREPPGGGWRLASRGSSTNQATTGSRPRRTTLTLRPGVGQDLAGLREATVPSVRHNKGTRASITITTITHPSHASPAGRRVTDAGRRLSGWWRHESGNREAMNQAIHKFARR